MLVFVTRTIKYHQNLGTPTTTDVSTISSTSAALTSGTTATTFPTSSATKISNTSVTATGRTTIINQPSNPVQQQTAGSSNTGEIITLFYYSLFCLCNLSCTVKVLTELDVASRRSILT